MCQLLTWAVEVQCGYTENSQECFSLGKVVLPEKVEL